MKKIIAFILVLMLTLTVLVACGDKDPETPDTDKPSQGDTSTPGGNEGGEDDEPEVIEHDSTGGLENQNQHDGSGTELPIVAMP